MSILISYDGSPSAKHALAVAAAVMPASRVTPMHVWNPPDPILHDSFGAPDVVAGASGRSLEQACLDRAEEVLQKAGRSRWVWARGGRQAQRSRHDSVAATILEVAEELDAVVVIGNRGATTGQPDVLGSVSHAVVYQSHLPLLVVPAPAGGEAAEIDPSQVAGRRQ